MILSTTRKIQAIANVLRGEPAGIDLADLDQPWSDYYKWIQVWIDEDPDNVDLQKLNFDFMSYWGVVDEIHRANYRLISQAMDHPFTYQSVNEILDSMPELEWLWPEWIPVGMLSILAASPGTGKSYFALDLARRVISGTTFPDDSPVGQPGRVLYVDAENTPTIYKQRLSTWQDYEKRHFYYLKPDPERLILNLDDAADRDDFLDAICVIRPRLTIIDSYGAATLRGDRYKEDVQDLLSFLTKVASDHRTAMLLVHHLRKRPDENSFLPMTLDSIRGSSHIPAMARNVLGMQWANGRGDKNTPRRLWVMKSNIGQYPPAIGVVFKPNADRPEVAEIEYIDAPELEHQEVTKTEECETWLIELLQDANDPIKPRDILNLGQELGYNQRMIHRVRRRLGDRIRDTEGRFNPENCWELVEDDDSPAEEGEVE
jgi:hypothetical protein